MKVVVITGMPGSGKSAAVDVARSKGIPVFRMGDAVWDEVRSRGLELDKDLVGSIATEMRETHGPSIWAQRTIDMVRKGPDAEIIIIDGCRSKAELAAFRAEFGDGLMVLAILASEATRFKRLRARSREDDIRTLEDFRARDERELKWGLGEMIAAADRTIHNEGPLEEIRERIARLLETL